MFTMTGSYLSAQVSQQWTASYNSPTNGSDIPAALLCDNSGNIYVTGVSPATTTQDDFATVKYNSAGVQQWAVRYNNPSNLDDNVTGMAIDASGNVYVTGSISTGTSGVQMTIKYNSSGALQWASQLGLPMVSPAAPGKGNSCIAVDASGNIYVGGVRQFGASQNGSYLLIKYNSNGDSVWTRYYKGSHFLAGLGSAIVCIKIDGNFIYVTGKSFDQNPDLSTSTFATTIKYDLSGTRQWLRKDTLINGSDDVIGMEIDASGNIVVTCNYGLDIITYKYNSAGAKLWEKIYAGIGGTFYDRVTALALDQSGNIHLTGNSTRTTGSGGEDFMTLKYNASGILLWEKFYNGSYGDGDYANGICVDAAGNVYVTGATYETGFHFNYTTIKYDTDGNQKWKISYDGSNNQNDDRATAIVLDPSQNVIVTGVSDRSGSLDDYTTIKYSQTVGIIQISSSIPGKFSLLQNYPNPFNPITNLEFGISHLGFVSLKIFDMLGKEVATLVNTNLNPGYYKYNFDASALNSGIYFYKLETADFSETKKMLLIK